MSKRSVVLIALLFVLFGVSTSLAAVDVPIYKDTFVRGTGTPIVEIRDFTAPPGPAKLIIRNGAEDDDSEKVSSSVIKLNGNDILTQEYFNQDVSYLEADVSLLEQNSLSVELWGKPKGAILVEIILTSDADGAGLIGSNGGRIEIVDPDSPLYGAYVDIGPNVIDSATLIQLKTPNLVPEMPDNFFPISESVEIICEKELKGLAKVTLPLSNEINERGLILAYHYDEGDDNNPSILPIVKWDREENLATIATDSFSIFVVVNSIPFTVPMQATVDFNYNESCFNENFINPGQCYGMANFSLWYHLSGLMPMLRCAWNENDTSEVVNRAHNVIWNWQEHITAGLIWEVNHLNLISGQRGVRDVLLYHIAINKAPTTLVMAPLAWDDQESHAVVVFGYSAVSEDTIEIYCYDPNFPTQRRTIFCTRDFLGRWFLIDYDYPDFKVFFQRYVADNYFTELNQIINDYPTFDSDGNGIGDICDLPGGCPNDFYTKTPYDGDCTNRPAGSVCVDYSDGYTWLVYDGIEYIDSFGGIETAHGYINNYQHYTGTECIYKENLGFEVVVQNYYNTEYFIAANIKNHTLIDSLRVIDGPNIQNAWANLAFLSERPDPGDVYQIQIIYTDQTSRIIPFTVSNINDNFAQIISPSSIVIDPNFQISWQRASGTVTGQFIVIQDSYSQNVWMKALNNTDINCTFDGQLTDGEKYYLYLHSYNEFGNQATTRQEFEYHDGDYIVSFPDPVLEQAIRDVIEKQEGDIYQSDLLGLVAIWAEDSISDLNGIQYCTDLGILNITGDFSDINYLKNLNKLERLIISGNQSIVDYTPISNLTNLVFLSLMSNKLSDIHFIESLNNLESIQLGDNHINDLTSISGLTKLKRLYLWSNDIDNLYPISDLVQLESLFLGGNSIYDISPIGNIENLKQLSVEHNLIDDVESLYNLTQLQEIGLWGNNIQDITTIINLPNLQRLDVRLNPLNYDSCVAIDLSNIEIYHDCPTLNLSVYSGSGQWGETISQTGNGFCPNDEAILHFMSPTGNEETPVSVRVDSLGGFYHTYTIPVNKETGTWTYWAKDVWSGLESPRVNYTISSTSAIVNPIVASTSGSRSQADTLFQPAYGFTPNGIAELHFRRPDGSLSPTTTEAVRSDGEFEHYWTITPDAQLGTYQYWAVDLSSGLTSPEVSYQIYE